MRSHRVAVVAFLFFLLKGLGWLLLPAAVYLWAR